MKLTVQKRIAAKLLKTSPKNVKMDSSLLSTIKDAITKSDIRNMISSGAITKKPTSQQSRGRANVRLAQKRKGRLQGTGTRKGKPNARASTKDQWVNKIRAQRNFLRKLKEKGHITPQTFRNLYRKAHGGYFRNVRHIKLYVDEHELAVKQQAEPTTTKKKSSTKQSKQGEQ